MCSCREAPQVEKFTVSSPSDSCFHVRAWGIARGRTVSSCRFFSPSKLDSSSLPTSDGFSIQGHSSTHTPHHIAILGFAAFGRRWSPLWSVDRPPVAFLDHSVFTSLRFHSFRAVKKCISHRYEVVLAPNTWVQSPLLKLRNASHTNSNYVSKKTSMQF